MYSLNTTDPSDDPTLELPVLSLAGENRFDIGDDIVQSREPSADRGADPVSRLMERINERIDRELRGESAPRARMRFVMVTGSIDWVNGMAVLKALESELTRSPAGLVVVCGGDPSVNVIAQQWAAASRRAGNDVAIITHNEPNIDDSERSRRMMTWGAGVCHVFATSGSPWNHELARRCLETGVLVVGHATEARAEAIRSVIHADVLPVTPDVVALETDGGNELPDVRRSHLRIVS